MKYKVGDRVRIKNFDWFRNEGAHNMVVAYMKKYYGEVVTIKSVHKDFYRIKEDDWQYCWTDEMIEGLVEDEVFIKANDIYNEEYSKGEYCHEQSFKWGFQEGYNYSHENDKLEISLKEGYHFVDENGNVINATKIVLEKKKNEYPKTDDIIKWLRECDMTKYIGVIYSGMCSITFDTEKLIKDITEMMGDD